MNKKNTLTFIVFLFSLQTFSQAPGWLWAKPKGGTGNDFGQSVAIDVTGNVYTVGSFTGTSDFDPGVGVFNMTSAGFSDIFISKLDAAGNFIWAKRIGGTNFDFALHMVFSGSIYVTGNFQGTVDFDPDTGVVNLISAGNSDEDIFIAKFDTSGSLIWANAMTGAGYDVGYALAFDISGSIYTIGYFSQTVDFDPGPGTFSLTSNGNYDVFISQLDGTGNFIWAKQLVGAGLDYGHSIYVDGTGNVFTTGQFSGTVDFDPGAGTFNMTSIGSEDIFVLMLDNNGNFMWAKQMGGTSGTGTAIMLDAFSNILYAGYFYGTVDFNPGAGIFNLTSAGQRDIFVAKLDGSGNFLWAKGFGGPNDDEGLSIASNISNDVFTTGYFDGTVDFDPDTSTFNLTAAGSSDIFISKLDFLGNFVWAKATGGTLDDRGVSIALNNADNIYVAGSFSSSVVLFDAIPLSNVGAADVFVGKIDNIITATENVYNSDGISFYTDLITSEIILNFDKEGLHDVRLFSLSGEILERVQATSSSVSLDMSRYSKGIYFITVTAENNRWIKKIVKM